MFDVGGEEVEKELKQQTVGTQRDLVVRNPFFISNV